MATVRRDIKLWIACCGDTAVPRASTPSALPSFNVFGAAHLTLSIATPVRKGFLAFMHTHSSLCTSSDTGFHEMGPNDLQEDHEISKKGFNARITILEQEFSAFRREFDEHRNDQRKGRVEQPETQVVVVSDATALREIFEDIGRKIKCPICLDVCNLPYSLDCYHVFCGPCLLGWFTTLGDTVCPTCLIESKSQPQPNYAVRGILSVIRGRDIPTDPSENFDSSGLAQIYREKEERKRRGGY